MSLLDRLLGHTRPAPTRPATVRPETTPLDGDARAVDRYRYLLRTAPPGQIEQAHQEAFEALTPEQRRQVLAALATDAPEAASTDASDPAAMARVATRAEMRQPGTMERVLGRSGGGIGLGGALLAGVAGAFIGSTVADFVFDEGLGDVGLFDLGGEAQFEDAFGSFGGFDF